jgi:hypothetical protein
MRTLHGKAFCVPDHRRPRRRCIPNTCRIILSARRCCRAARISFRRTAMLWGHGAFATSTAQP